MSAIPSFREQLISQIPALQLLMALGYEYLAPEQALRLRGSRVSQAVLTGILEAWLREHNAITHKGQTHAFSHANIQEAMRALTSEPVEQGLIPANQRVYELLTLGASLTQAIESDTKSYSPQTPSSSPRPNTVQMAARTSRGCHCRCPGYTLTRSRSRRHAP